jgi:hypothetical protein
MRADLRRAHRRIWPLLAALLVAGFVLGLVLKPERPVAPGSVAGETRP